LTICNLILIISLGYIIFKLFHLKKIYYSLDDILIKFMNNVFSLNTTLTKFIEDSTKVLDRTVKNTNNLFVIQKEIETLKKELSAFHTLNTNYNTNISSYDRVNRDTINGFKSKITEFNVKLHKLSLIISELSKLKK